jgi:hypothetical protein
MHNKFLRKFVSSRTIKINHISIDALTRYENFYLKGSFINDGSFIIKYRYHFKSHHLQTISIITNITKHIPLNYSKNEIEIVVLKFQLLLKGS